MKFKFKKLSLLAALALGFGFSNSLILNFDINNIAYANLVSESTLKDAGSCLKRMVSILSNGFENDNKAEEIKEIVAELGKTMNEIYKFDTTDLEYAGSQLTSHESVIDSLKEMGFTGNQATNIGVLKEAGEGSLDFKYGEINDNINTTAAILSSMIDPSISQKLENLLEKLKKVEESAEAQKEDMVVEIDYEKNSSESSSLSDSSNPSQTSSEQVVESDLPNKSINSSSSDQAAPKSSDIEEDDNDDEIARLVNSEISQKSYGESKDDFDEKVLDEEFIVGQNAVYAVKKFFKNVESSFRQIHNKLNNLGYALGFKTYKKLCISVGISGIRTMRKGLTNSKALAKILQKRVKTLKSSKQKNSNFLGTYFEKNVMPLITGDLPYSFKNLVEFLQTPTEEDPNVYKIKRDGLTKEAYTKFVKNCKIFRAKLNFVIKQLTKSRIKQRVLEPKTKVSAVKKKQQSLKQKTQKKN